MRRRLGVNDWAPISGPFAWLAASGLWIPEKSSAWASPEEDFNSNLAAFWAQLDNPARNKNDAQSTRAELFVGLSLQAPDLSDARWGMAMAAGIRGLDFGACWRVALGRGSQVIKLIHA